MADIQKNFDQTVSGYLQPLKNEYINAALALFLILYAGVIAPKLPASVLKWFDNIFVKIVVFFTIVWISKKDPSVALIASIAVLVTLMIANNQYGLQNLSDETKVDGFCSCRTPTTNRPADHTHNTYLPDGSSMAHDDITVINGWYTYNDLETENGMIEDEANEPDYPDHNVQITPAPTTVRSHLYNNGKSVEEPTHPDHHTMANKKEHRILNGYAVETSHPDHNVEITEVVTPSPSTATTTAPRITRSSVPRMTRLPLIDPEYPDHTHRMYTTAPAQVYNGGKSVMEPSHPDHLTLANKKEHRILNQYVVEPSHPDHLTLANKKEHRILNQYVGEKFNQGQHSMGDMEDHLNHLNHTEEPIQSEDMSLEHNNKNYFKTGSVEGRVNSECRAVENSKEMDALNGFAADDSYHSA